MKHFPLCQIMILTSFFFFAGDSTIASTAFRADLTFD
jgi:hypothetical protein